MHLIIIQHVGWPFWTHYSKHAIHYSNKKWSVGWLGIPGYTRRHCQGATLIYLSNWQEISNSTACTLIYLSNLVESIVRLHTKRACRPVRRNRACRRDCFATRATFIPLPYNTLVYIYSCMQRRQNRCCRAGPRDDRSAARFTVTQSPRSW